MCVLSSSLKVETTASPSCPSTQQKAEDQGLATTAWASRNPGRVWGKFIKQRMAGMGQDGAGGGSVPLEINRPRLGSSLLGHSHQRR